MRKTLKLVIGILLGCVTSAQATVNVTVTPSNGGTYTVTTVNGREQVALNRDAGVSGTVDFLVTGASNEAFDTITVATNNSSDLSTVRLRGASPNTKTGSAEAIMKSGTGTVTVSELRLFGDLGANLGSGNAVDVDTVAVLLVDGTVHKSFNVTNTSFEIGSSIGGNLLGGILVSNGSILNLPIAGNIGASDARVTVTVHGDVVRLEAANIYADIDIAGALQTFRVVGTPGEVHGSFHVGRLAVVGSGTGEFITSGGIIPGFAATGFVIDGDINVPTTLLVSQRTVEVHGDIRSPVTLLGDTSIDADGQLTSTIRRTTDDLWCGSLTLGSMGANSLIQFDCQMGGSIHINSSVPSSARIDIMTDMSLSCIEAASIVIFGDMDGEITIGRPSQFGGNMRGLLRVTGNLNGTVRVRERSLLDGIRGSINFGTIEINGDLVGTIWVDVSLASSGTISIGGPTALPSTNLRGQVIINRSNREENGWFGDVFVNQELISGPYYTIPSSQLGGGAIGLAPFHLYEADCVPPNNGYITVAQFQSSGALMRYYGPVVMGPGMPPVVEMRDPYNENVWQPMPMGFVVDINPVVAGRFRTIRARYTGSSGLLSPGRYRIHLDEGSLVSSGIQNTPDVEGGDYFFNVVFDCDNNGPDAGDLLSGTYNPAIDCDRNGVLDTCDITNRPGRDSDHNGVLDTCQNPCPCDWNADLFTNSQDFFDFLVDFFSNDADYNHDGFTNSQDFFDFLYCFFGGC